MIKFLEWFFQFIFREKSEEEIFESDYRKVKTGRKYYGNLY